MTDNPGGIEDGAVRPARPLWRALIKLARPHQWAKSGFVLLGPLYALQDTARPALDLLLPALFAAVAFSLASSACYIVNDIFDAPRDRAHPRKRTRPIAAGEVTPRQAWVFAGVLVVAAAASLALLGSVWLGVGIVLALYVLNVQAYTMKLKHIVIADVVSLSLGFVLRVFAGCAAAEVAPSTWLLNSTLFFAMFLAFGKRLGEKRTMREDAANARGVLAVYTDHLLRMAVVVTAVAMLLTYADYVQSRDGRYTDAVPLLGVSFNLLWLTTIPATFGLLRCIVLLESGRYDDPTELVARDRPMQAAVLAFALVTAAVISRGVWAG